MYTQKGCIMEKLFLKMDDASFFKIPASKMFLFLDAPLSPKSDVKKL